MSGACDPFERPATAEVSPARYTEMLGLLTRRELETLALQFYGHSPERFEELLLRAWAKRTAEPVTVDSAIGRLRAAVDAEAAL